MSNATATQPPKAAQQPPPQQHQLALIRTKLEQAKPMLQEAAQQHLSVERCTRLLLSACSRNPELLKCTPESVLLFAMKCTETGLEPIGPGGAWPIPFKNTKAGTVEMQFIPDYRGLVHCAKRAGCITDAYAEVVKANDEFSYELGLNPTLTHKPARGDRGALEAAYCAFALPDGTKRFVVMDRAEIESIRRRSRAAQSGPWVTDEAEMWKKSVTRRAMKPFAGANAALDAAIEADDAALGLDGEADRAPIPMPQAIAGQAEAEPPAQPPAQPAAEAKPDAAAQAGQADGQGQGDQPASEQLQLQIRQVISAKKVNEATVSKLLRQLGAKKLQGITVDQGDKLLAMLEELESAGE